MKPIIYIDWIVVSLTHWPLRDIKVILQVYFSNTFYEWQTKPIHYIDHRHYREFSTTLANFISLVGRKRPQLHSQTYLCFHFLYKLKKYFWKGKNKVKFYRIFIIDMLVSNLHWGTPHMGQYVYNAVWYTRCIVIGHVPFNQTEVKGIENIKLHAKPVAWRRYSINIIILISF